MAFISGSSSVPSSEINVTPLIDVLLVLLIIFMMIVPVTPRGLSSEIPQGRASAEVSTQPVSVRVLRNSAPGGQVRYEGELRYEVDGQPVAPSALGGTLRGRLAKRSRRMVWVTADADVTYRVVAEVVSQAQGAGAQTVGLGRL